jgi:hypothetical protein
MAFVSSRSETANVLTAAAAAGGALSRYLVARSLAFRLGLKAQLMLCQAQIEKNTR